MVLLCTLFLCVCHHCLCLEGTLRGFSVGWELSAFLPPGPMQTLGLSTPGLITALLATTPKWGWPPCHFTLHCLKIKIKWNTLYTENPSIWITDFFPMGNPISTQESAKISTQESKKEAGTSIMPKEARSISCSVINKSAFWNILQQNYPAARHKIPIL